MNATLVPSGDHPGSKSLAGSVVSLCSPDPFAFTAQMSSVLFENVIRPERAERSMEPELRVGPRDSRRGWVMGQGTLPGFDLVTTVVGRGCSSTLPG